MEGRIIKAVSGFYYVQRGEELWTCRARGLFRNTGVKPLPGDSVSFDIIPEQELTGSITEVLARKNELLRPAVTNVDQAMIVFAVKEPDPNFNLLDRFLCQVGMQGLPCVVYFNKADLLPPETVMHYRGIYEKAGYSCISGSTGSDETVSEIKEALSGKTTVLAGPSGAGKSSLTNRLFGKDCMEVGELSKKIMRGKQTTRHTELFPLGNDTYVIDTPGFTSLYVSGIKSSELSGYYSEFKEPAEECRFQGCSHVNEPQSVCMVKREVENGTINRMRYDNYCRIYKEIKEAEKRYQHF